MTQATPINRIIRTIFSFHSDKSKKDLTKPQKYSTKPEFISIK